jgi:hypothetical protein
MFRGRNVYGTIEYDKVDRHRDLDRICVVPSPAIGVEDQANIKLLLEMADQLEDDKKNFREEMWRVRRERNLAWEKITKGLKED